jgi:hypothetical protein
LCNIFLFFVLLFSYFPHGETESIYGGDRAHIQCKTKTFQVLIMKVLKSLPEKNANLGSSIVVS